MLETSYPNFEPSAGYMTESVQRAYISKGIEKNILPKEAHRMPEILSLVASNDLQKPIQFWQLFSQSTNSRLHVDEHNKSSIWQFRMQSIKMTSQSSQ